jgi:hypothetical protein
MPDHSLSTHHPNPAPSKASFFNVEDWEEGTHGTQNEPTRNPNLKHCLIGRVHRRSYSMRDMPCNQRAKRLNIFLSPGGVTLATNKDWHGRGLRLAGSADPLRRPCFACRLRRLAKHCLPGRTIAGSGSTTPLKGGPELKNATKPRQLVAGRESPTWRNFTVPNVNPSRLRSSLAKA